MLGVYHYPASSLASAPRRRIQGSKWLEPLSIPRGHFSARVIERAGVRTSFRHSAGHLIGKGCQRPNCHRDRHFETTSQPGWLPTSTTLSLGAGVSTLTEDEEVPTSLSAALTGRNLRPSLSLRTSMPIWFLRLLPTYLLHSFLTEPDMGSKCLCIIRMCFLSSWSNTIRLICIPIHIHRTSIQSFIPLTTPR